MKLKLNLQRKVKKRLPKRVSAEFYVPEFPDTVRSADFMPDLHRLRFSLQTEQNFLHSLESIMFFPTKALLLIDSKKLANPGLIL